MCIVLSLSLLRKPIGILKESFADLVDAKPYAKTANIVEESARECVRQAVDAEMGRLNPDLDVSVPFRSG